MAKRRSYDDKFRASAVVMLEAAGYPNTKGALERTAKRLGIASMTISRWFNAANNPPPNEIVIVKRGELIDWINDELSAVFGVLPGKRDEASYRDLMTGVGILVDKRQLLTGNPTENLRQKIVIEYESQENKPTYVKNSITDASYGTKEGDNNTGEI